MSSVPSELQYTKEHEWVAPASQPNVYRIGITDFAQGALGDIVYIQLPKMGQEVKADAVCGAVESTKSVSEIYSPVTGKVVAINNELDKAPEAINSDPYGAGWICEIEVAATPMALLSAAEYTALTA